MRIAKRPGFSYRLSEQTMRKQTIDGIEPAAVKAPESLEELSHLLAEAEKAVQVIVPAGGGTKLDWGRVPPCVDQLVWMDHFNRIIDYEPADLTVTVEAGCKLATLQSTLAQHGQFLPVDPPYPDDATVGGVVACNLAGALRFRYGPVRDQVIGMRVAHADGRISKAGSRVVKNVSGYDLCKLYTGSYGTLGVITEVNFKLQPLPESEATCVIMFDNSSDAQEAVQKILRSQLLPDALELIDAKAAMRLNQMMGTEWLEPKLTLLVRWADVPQAVKWQSKELVNNVLPANKGEATVLAEDFHRGIWPQLVRFRSNLIGPDEHLIVCRVVVPLGYIGEVFERAAEMEKKMRSVVYRLSHAGNGIVYLYLTGGDILLDRAEVFARELEQLRKFSIGFGGYTVVEIAPRPIKDRIDVWGFEAIPDGARRLMSALKEEFDPKHIFNRGRYA